MANAENEQNEIGQIANSWTIFHQYVTIMNDYLNHFMASEKFKRRDSDSDFLLMNGFTTLTHVFKITLNNVNANNNVDKAIEQTEQSIYYYTQFIEQMEENIMDDLNVSSNTASLFVYKKTIQHLPPDNNKKNEMLKNEVLKNEVLKNEVLKNVDYVLLIYRNIADMLMPSNMFTSCNKHMPLDMPIYLLSIAFELCQNNTTEETFRADLTNVMFFIHHFSTATAMNTVPLHEYIQLYVKKYRHCELTVAELCQKKAHPSYADKLKNETAAN